MVTDVTVKFLATELNISVDRLIRQFSDIGIQKIDLDCVSEDEKKILLTHMNRNKGQLGMLNRLTLQRKIRSTLNCFSSGGKSKKVQIEVRKKRTYVRYDPKVLRNIHKDSISCSEEANDFYSDISEKNTGSKESLERNLKKCSNRDRDFILLDKNINKNNNNNIVHKNITCTQSNNFIQNICTVKKNSNIVLGAVSVPFNEDNTTENDYKKKVSHDRRSRGRQRVRFSKFRNNTKVNNNIKYKRNYNHFLDIRYDREELSSFTLRETNNQQRKISVLNHAFSKPTHIVSRDIILGEIITVAELANKMAIKSSHLIAVMMKLGLIVTVNQVIDQKTAKLIAEDMGHHVILHRENDLEEMIINDRNSSIIDDGTSGIFKVRAPVVTIMGHVDHGKTSLLDYIRSSRVVDSEVGGITQRIGAYSVKVSHDEKMITFLDTPGHAAFTSMRFRGVKITDLVVLVVAVDDGVMLQTVEAIQHIKCVKIPIIVALNKIDKIGDFDINRIKSDLATQGIISEEWGGDTQFVSVSAKSGVGVDNLLDAILLESELLELKVSHDGMASGVVIESYLDKGRGPVAVILIQEGMLKCGDIILCGLEYGRIRAMRNDQGDNVNEAGPSIPVEVFGLSGPPFSGDLMFVVRNEKKAREVALYRKGKFRSEKLEQNKQSKLSSALTNITNEGSIHTVKCNIILKADVQGSVEAICDVLKNLSNSNIKINIVGSGVGGINETDVSLAVSTKAILLGFNVRADISARRVIELENLSIYYHSIIYDLIDDIKKIIDGMLIPKNEIKYIALVEVRDVFNFPKLGNIAGCMVLEGVVHRYDKVRVLRKKVVVHEGELESLRRFKNDVIEVRAGMECGIVIKNYKDIHSGDFIEIFENINTNTSLIST